MRLLQNPDGLQGKATQYGGKKTGQTGGKGINVSLALQRLGQETAALGFAAGRIGQTIRDLLDDMGCPHKLLELSGGGQSDQERVTAQALPKGLAAAVQHGHTARGHHLLEDGDVKGDALGPAGEHHRVRGIHAAQQLQQPRHVVLPQIGAHAVDRRLLGRCVFVIYTITTNPSLDYTVEVDLVMGQVNRTKSEVIYPGGRSSSFIEDQYNDPVLCPSIWSRTPVNPREIKFAKTMPHW